MTVSVSKVDFVHRESSFNNRNCSMMLRMVLPPPYSSLTVLGCFSLSTSLVASGGSIVGEMTPSMTNLVTLHKIVMNDASVFVGTQFISNKYKYSLGNWCIIDFNPERSPRKGAHEKFQARSRLMMTAEKQTIREQSRAVAREEWALEAI